ncbi:hypothetical protein [Pseudochelatococcus sp. G4_1912]|jgi:hypothetical protein|uniref:hypothetical protein n=1 Tax=Pseudochelatococcus sp. G4_1912 TaxID=3114288 RepID=UPI0039C72082
MTTISYIVGDQVNLRPGIYGQPRSGSFEITRLMPARDDNGEQQFRVRGPDGIERAVNRHEITGMKNRKDQSI